MTTEIKTMEERKKALIELGKKQDGKITYEQIAEELKGLDIDSDTLDDLYNAFVENKIEIKADDEDDTDNGEILTPDSLEVEDLTLSKDVKINDPVRMYLKEIGRINLLTSDEEFEYKPIEVEKRTFEPKMYLYPIPQADLNTTGWVQNPLW